MKRNRTKPLTRTVTLLLCLCLLGVPTAGLTAAAVGAQKGYDQYGVLVPEAYDGQVILEDPALLAASDDTDGIYEGDNTNVPSPSPDATVNPTTDPTTEPSVEPTATTAPTAEPSDDPAPPASAPSYTIEINVPDGWRNTVSVKVSVTITDHASSGWKKVELRPPHASWQDVTAQITGTNSTEVEISDNGTMSVRVTDPQGSVHEASVDVRCFDREAPVVSAGIRNVLLHVEAKDALSGVAGIQVNGLLFTVLEDGVLDVRIEEALKEYEKLGIRAYDYAGNFSAPVTLDNPYYSGGTCPTQAPTATPKPTKTPTKTAKPTATPKPTKKPSSGNSVTAISTPVPTSTVQSVIATTDAVLPFATQAPSYISLEPGTPYQNSGNMQTLDLLYSANTNKQFITVQTRSGETYYLIIDYDKPIDADADLYETYFLNLVDDRDLLSVLGEDSLPTPEPTVIIATPAPTAVPTQAPNTEAASNAGGGTMGLLLVLVVLAAGGALWYFKFSKNGNGGKNKRSAFDEYDFDEDEDEPTEVEEHEDE